MTRVRPATLAGLGLVSIALVGLVGIGLSNALVYSLTPTELGRSTGGGTVRLYGLIVPGSPHWDAETSTLSFAVTDGTTTVDVDSSSLPQGELRDGTAVVLVGHAAGARFVASELLAKHSEVYRALAPGETMPPSILADLGLSGQG
jgi:cytochrome c-type biogenesis protein CcmE